MTSSRNDERYSSVNSAYHQGRYNNDRPSRTANERGRADVELRGRTSSDTSSVIDAKRSSRNGAAPPPAAPNTSNNVISTRDPRRTSVSQDTKRQSLSSTSTSVQPSPITPSGSAHNGTTLVSNSSTLPDLVQQAGNIIAEIAIAKLKRETHRESAVRPQIEIVQSAEQKRNLPKGMLDLMKAQKEEREEINRSLHKVLTKHRDHLGSLCDKIARQATLDIKNSSIGQHSPKGDINSEETRISLNAVNAEIRELRENIAQLRGRDEDATSIQKGSPNRAEPPDQFLARIKALEDYVPKIRAEVEHSVEIRCAKNELELTRQYIKTLEQQASAEKQLKQAKDELETSKDHIKRLENESTALKMEIEARRAKSDQTESELLTLKETSTVLSSEMQQVKAQLAILTSRNERPETGDSFIVDTTSLKNLTICQNGLKSLETCILGSDDKPGSGLQDIASDNRRHIINLNKDAIDFENRIKAMETQRSPQSSALLSAGSIERKLESLDQNLDRINHETTESYEVFFKDSRQIRKQAKASTAAIDQLKLVVGTYFKSNTESITMLRECHDEMKARLISLTEDHEERLHSIDQSLRIGQDTLDRTASSVNENSQIITDLSKRRLDTAIDEKVNEKIKTLQIICQNLNARISSITTEQLANSIIHYIIKTHPNVSKIQESFRIQSSQMGDLRVALQRHATTIEDLCTKAVDHQVRLETAEASVMILEALATQRLSHPSTPSFDQSLVGHEVLDPAVLANKKKSKAAKLILESIKATTASLSPNNMGDSVVAVVGEDGTVQSNSVRHEKPSAAETSESAAQEEINEPTRRTEKPSGKAAMPSEASSHVNSETQSAIPQNTESKITRQVGNGTKASETSSASVKHVSTHSKPSNAPVTPRSSNSRKRQHVVDDKSDDNDGEWKPHLGHKKIALDKNRSPKSTRVPSKMGNDGANDNRKGGVGRSALLDEESVVKQLKSTGTRSRPFNPTL